MIEDLFKYEWKDVTFEDNAIEIDEPELACDIGNYHKGDIIAIVRIDVLNNHLEFLDEDGNETDCFTLILTVGEQING